MNYLEDLRLKHIKTSNAYIHLNTYIVHVCACIFAFELEIGILCFMLCLALLAVPGGFVCTKLVDSFGSFCMVFLHVCAFAHVCLWISLGLRLKLCLTFITVQNPDKLLMRRNDAQILAGSVTVDGGRAYECAKHPRLCKAGES